MPDAMEMKCKSALPAGADKCIPLRDYSPGHHSTHCSSSELSYSSFAHNSEGHTRGLALGCLKTKTICLKRDWI